MALSDPRAHGGAGESRGRRLAARLWLLGPLALFAVLRIPSFFEPHWYTDEAGYVTTARSLLHGQVLYSQVWNNKPPLDLWTVAATIRLLGTSEAALHAVTFLSGLAALLAVAYAGRRLLGTGRTVLALLVLAVLLGSPIFDAQLILPESLLIAPVTWAGALLLTRLARPDARRWPLWPIGVGALAAAALCYQQTALAETCAFALILGLAAAASWRRVALYAGTVAGLTAAWVVPAIITAGAGNVGFALVGFWVPFTQAQWTGAGAMGSHLVLPAVALVLLVGAPWLRGRDPGVTWALWVWAGAALLVPAVARQPYAHYLLPSLIPSVMAVSSIPLRRPVATSARRALAAAGLLAGTVLAAVGASVAGLDWVIPAPGSTQSLANYYLGGVSLLTGGESLHQWQDHFDYRVVEDRQVASWMDAHGLRGSSAVIWSADAWLYELADVPLLLPTPPIYNDEVLLGDQGQVAQRVSDLDPHVVVTEGESRAQWPEIDPVLAAGYEEADESGSEIVWVRDDLVATVTGSATPS